MDGAALVFEEWAGDAEGEVAESEGVGRFFFKRRRGCADFLRKAACFDLFGGGAESGAERFPSLFRLDVNVFGKSAGFDRRERWARPDGSRLRNPRGKRDLGLADSGGFVFCEGGDGSGEILNDGQQDGGADGAIGELRADVQAAAWILSEDWRVLRAGSDILASELLEIRDRRSGNRKQETVCCPTAGRAGPSTTCAAAHFAQDDNFVGRLPIDLARRTRFLQ